MRRIILSIGDYGIRGLTGRIWSSRFPSGQCWQVWSLRRCHITPVAWRCSRGGAQPNSSFPSGNWSRSLCQNARPSEGIALYLEQKEKIEMPYVLGVGSNKHHEPQFLLSCFKIRMMPVFKFCSDKEHCRDVACSVHNSSIAIEV